MQIHNGSSSIVTIGDIPGNQPNDLGYPAMGLTFQPGATIAVNDTDADKSLQLGAMINAGLLSITGADEPTAGLPNSVGLYALQASVNALWIQVRALQAGT